MEIGEYKDYIEIGAAVRPSTIIISRTDVAAQTLTIAVDLQTSLNGIPVYSQNASTAGAPAGGSVIVIENYTGQIGGRASGSGVNVSIAVVESEFTTISGVNVTRI